MKLIIAGSREITDYQTFLECIKLCGITPNDITEVVCGMARGVDTLGKQWALTNNLPVKEFPADWNKDGKAAGFLRNLDMARYADALLAIWDGKSRGTAHMIKSAQSHQLKTWVCEIT